MNRLVRSRMRHRRLRDEANEALRTLSAIRNGEIDAFVVLREGEKRVFTLSGAETPYRHFVEAMSEGAATVQRDGSIIYCNRRFAEILGVPAEHLIGSSLAHWIHPDDHPMVRRVLETREQPLRGEARVLSGTGGEVPIQLSASVLEMSGHDVVCLLASDLSGEKRSLAELQQAYRHLEEANRQKDVYQAGLREAMDLQDRQQRAQIEQLKQVDALKVDFLNAVSHELRTPLSSILGYAEFLEDEMGGDLTAEQRKYVLGISNGADRLRHLVDDLLDFARLEAGTFRMAPQDVDIHQVVDLALRSLEPQIASAGVSLETDLPPEPLNVRIDPARVEQIILNLVGNSIKFTMAGGHIKVVVKRQNDELILAVQDTGIGITADCLPRIFEKFFQVDPSMTRTRGGAGLGLTIAKALAEAHGGRIQAESTPGEGSTFWFTMPMTPPRSSD